MKKKHVLWKLFISTLYLSAFTFGGGYVIVTLIKKKFVDELHWIEEDEMLDLIAMPSPRPGPLRSTGPLWWATSWQACWGLGGDPGDDPSALCDHFRNFLFL